MSPNRFPAHSTSAGRTVSKRLAVVAAIAAASVLMAGTVAHAEGSDPIPVPEPSEVQLEPCEITSVDPDLIDCVDLDAQAEDGRSEAPAPDDVTEPVCDPQPLPQPDPAPEEPAPGPGDGTDGAPPNVLSVQAGCSEPPAPEVDGPDPDPTDPADCPPIPIPEGYDLRELPDGCLPEECEIWPDVIDASAGTLGVECPTETDDPTVVVEVLVDPPILAHPTFTG